MARADLALLLLFVVLRSTRSEIIFPCNWDEQCQWKWNQSEEGLRKTTGQRLTASQKSGPAKDAGGDENGSFLYLPGFRHPPSHVFNLTSPLLNASESGQCRVLFSEHSASASPDAIKLVIVSPGLPVDVGKHHVSSQNSWRNVNQRLGKILYPFQVVIEFVPSNISYSHVAIDNLRLENCTETNLTAGACVGQNQFECDNKKCIDQSRVCDLHVDCPTGEDEGKICEEVPVHARCDFETVGDEMCGWSNDQNDQLEWIRRQGAVTQLKPDNPYKNLRGLKHDNTYRNGSGHYLYMTNSKMMEEATLNSATFEPPPKCHGDIHSVYFNSCQIRFYYYMSDSNVGDLNLYCVEKPLGHGENKIHVWGRSGSQREKWIRAVLPLPRLLNKFHVQFVGRQGRFRGDIAIDDISFSPQCFGIGIPDNVTGPGSTIVHPTSDPFPRTYSAYKFNTCGAKGRFGPTNAMCNATYSSAEISVSVANEGNMSGIQVWTVNKTGIYSVLARGASGGKGARSTRRSHGTIVRGVFNWTLGDVIYMLIGQQGSSSCQWTHCTILSHRATGIQGLAAQLNKPAANKGSGGGGGGATFIFQLDDVNRPKPLLVAAGGGGFSLDPNFSDQYYNPDGRPDNKSALPYSGTGHPMGAGGGGGWSFIQETNLTEFPSVGLSLTEGGVGGKPCAALINWEASGGFGGGGGACQAGGGGGGYAGGNAYYPDHSEKDGQGGVSFASGDHASSYGSLSESPGNVNIFPAFEGCGCSFLCVILDPDAREFTCICQENWQLANDNVSCEVPPGVGFQPGMRRHILILLLCVAVLLICIGTVIFFSYHRYRRQKMKSLRQELFGNAELQLNRLRQHTGGMITEYNPNYEFGGSTCTIQDLKEVPRDSLNLVKPLGQGAFGEVYQGTLTSVPDEARDLPVAVKTLPELSSAQAEMDFLMEALIMSKFNHPNIVRFIGVCFEKLPKFIVLELLPGGDLKSFLREQRPKPDRPSPLTMCDLLLLAIDVARGCRYLEENHFIHRDIAARNCLLSSKDVNRVVKIADFGMARDIYRADYYRKGGKAMLPVKWMPPEAFLDGIFTSKTDVWSFGVLLWEVMSLGYMPYPGRGNQEVMQLVTSGGRLEPPNNCPSPVYHIMVQCWNSIPDDRPNFVTILERLGYCLQDPDVISAALPVFHRPPSMERDATVMRPPDSEDRLLQVQRPSDSEPLSPSSTDYLIPIPASNYSLSTEKTDLASSVDSIDKLLELDEHRIPAPPAPSPVAPQTAKRRSGGYTSIPMAEDVTHNNVTDVWQRAPPNNAPVCKTPLPLDASMLGKQQNALPYPYMNVSVAAKAPPLDHKIDPFIIGNHYTEKEVNC